MSRTPETDFLLKEYEESRMFLSEVAEKFGDMEIQRNLAVEALKQYRGMTEDFLSQIEHVDEI